MKDKTSEIKAPAKKRTRNTAKTDQLAPAASNTSHAPREAVQADATELAAAPPRKSGGARRAAPEKSADRISSSALDDAISVADEEQVTAAPQGSGMRAVPSSEIPPVFEQARDRQQIKPNGKGKKAASRTGTNDDLDDKIKRRAYQIYLERAARGIDGTAHDDWCQAERELKG